MFQFKSLDFNITLGLQFMIEFQSWLFVVELYRIEYGLNSYGGIDELKTWSTMFKR